MASAFANQRRRSRGLDFVSLGAQEKFNRLKNMLLVIGRQDARPLVAALRRGNGGRSPGLVEVGMAYYGVAALIVSPTVPFTAF